MIVERKLAAILFADIVGYSKIKVDHLLSHTLSILDEFYGSLDESKCFHKNTWGDGIVLACSDPDDTLEYALLLRDRVRDHNWRRFGFSQPLSIRIGLHAATISTTTDGVAVLGISGTQVNLAARIEPIAPPDSILCSEPFHALVKDQSVGFVEFKDLGERQLAKDFGPAILFEITRTSEVGAVKEATNRKTFGASIPKVKKDFTDVEKDNFLEEGFKHIFEYIQEAGKLLQQEDKDIQFKSKVVSEEKLICEIFVKGNSKGKCQIWISKERFSYGIHYARDIGVMNNSYMEVLTVWTDGYELFLKSAGMLQQKSHPSGSLSHKDAAELYWNALVSQLQ